MKIFTEHQKLVQKWLYLTYIPLGGVLFLFLYVDYSQIILGRTIGDRPSSNFQLVIISLILMAFIILLQSTFLQTRIDEEGVKYKWHPFQRNYVVIPWMNILEYHLVKKQSFKYGYGISHNQVSHYLGGKIALEISLQSGKQIIIGTKKENEMKTVMEYYFVSKSLA